MFFEEQGLFAENSYFMKRRIKESGKASLWDFLIVIMVVAILYLGYARGLVDHFLAPQYQSTTLLNRKTVEEDPNAPVTRPGGEDAAVATSMGPTHPSASSGPESILRIERVPGTEPEEPAQESTSSATAGTATSSAFSEDEEEGGFGGGAQKKTAETSGSEDDDATPLPTHSFSDANASPGSFNPTASETPEEPTPVKLVGLERRYWPQQVRLLKATLFPVVFNGEEVGSASLPVGATVALTGITSEEKIVVQNGQASLEVAVADTDLVERVRVLQRVTGEVNTTPAPSTRTGGWDPRAHNPQQSNR